MTGLFMLISFYYLKIDAAIPPPGILLDRKDIF